MDVGGVYRRRNKDTRTKEEEQGSVKRRESGGGQGKIQLMEGRMLVCTT